MNYWKPEEDQFEDQAEEIVEETIEESVEEIDHSKEEVLVNVGDITKCGHKVNAILEDGRLLISNQAGAKVVNKDDIEIV